MMMMTPNTRTTLPIFESVRQIAVHNAINRRQWYNDRHNIWDERDYRPDEERAIVSFLRHNATNYEGVLAGLPAEFSNGCENVVAFEDDAYSTIRRRVHEQLAKVYPEIADLFCVYE